MDYIRLNKTEIRQIWSNLSKGQRSSGKFRPFDFHRRKKETGVVNELVNAKRSLLASIPFDKSGREIKSHFTGPIFPRNTCAHWKIPLEFFLLVSSTTEPTFPRQAWKNSQRPYLTVFRRFAQLTYLQPSLPKELVSLEKFRWSNCRF